jgi:hypothetical protein
MASKLQQAEIPELTGGLNNFLDARLIKDNESPDLLNMMFYESGLRKRYGYIASGTTYNSRIRGLGYIKTTALNTAVRMSGTYLRTLAGATITGATFSNDKNTNFVQGGEKLFVFNGTDNLASYDGSSCTQYKTETGWVTHIAEYGEYYNRRLYVNSLTYRDRVYFSGAFDPSTSSYLIGNFSSATGIYAGYMQFKPGAGSEVTGIRKFGDYLYVWLEDSIYRLKPTSSTGTTNALDHTIELVTNLHGCVSNRTIDQMENDLVFMAKGGVTTLGEVANYISLRTSNLGGRVLSTLNGIPDDQLKDMAGIYYDEKYYLAYSDGSVAYNNQLLVYDYRYKGWLLWNNINANCFLDHTDSNDERSLYFGSDYSGYVYELNQGINDVSLAINGYFYTKVYDFEEFSRLKKYFNYDVLFGSVYGIVKVDVYIDGEITDTVHISAGSSQDADGLGSLPLGTFPIGLDYNSSEGSTTVLTNEWKRFIKNLTKRKGETIQFKFSNNTASETFSVRQIITRFMAMPHQAYDRSKKIIT